MFKFRVNRKRWVRGDKNGHSSLLNDVNCMCCLGFLSKKVGYKTGEINGIGAPHSVVYGTGKNKYPSGLVKKTINFFGAPEATRQCRRIMTCNDSSEISDSVREARLKRLFATIGIEVEFYG